MKYDSSFEMERTSWSSSLVRVGASARGRSSSTPAVIIGAVTMKMMRSTSMTSTKGVTLISLIMPPPPWEGPDMPIGHLR